MKLRYPLIVISIALLTTALVATRVHADVKVFKSTDPDGHVTYGDKPTEEAIDFEVIEIKPTIASNDDDLDKRLERMAATTKRLQEDRKERESEHQEQGGQNTVVYYPAAYPPANYGRVYRSAIYPRNSHPGNNYSGNNHSGNNHRSKIEHYRAYQDGSDRLNNYHRRPDSVSLGVGFHSPRFSGSLQVGNRQSSHHRSRHDQSRHDHNLNKRGHDRQFALSPLRENLRPRAPSPYTNTRHSPRNNR